MPCRSLPCRTGGMNAIIVTIVLLLTGCGIVDEAVPAPAPSPSAADATAVASGAASADAVA